MKHLSMYPNGTCPNCGGPLFGDGYKTVLFCENADAETILYSEPDAKPVFCEPCDHKWEVVDDSFDHEYGTEIIRYMHCEKCDAHKPYERDDGPDDFPAQ